MKKVKISGDCFTSMKEHIFIRGRLLERKLFSHFFERGSKKGCLKALKAYQNEDGGFGNGIEADLVCPESSAVGAETALYTLDLLDINNHPILGQLVKWIENNQDDLGIIKHPPKTLRDYPHGSWWENPDDTRVLVVVGFLKKFGIMADTIFNKATDYFNSLSVPTEISFYDYPFFVYLKEFSKTQPQKELFSEFYSKLPAFFLENKSHYPLFSRYWYHAMNFVKKEVVESQARYFIEMIEEDGGVKNPHPNLPWWKPIFTLDGLIILKKFDLIDIDL